ncbi:MAG: hypothetical protein BWY68_00137 [bacterium ADurb.Bin400]|nr:MAG: hypothetical protein BWY68_00137 [bacterium ADurb.Bin400]
MIISPVRANLGEKYLRTGDDYLVQKKYISADLAYRKVLLLVPGDKEASKRRELVKLASNDVTKLRTFLNEKSAYNQLNLLEATESVPQDEVDAVKYSRELIERGEFQLAAIPAKTATEMDKTYRDAWLYLGIAHLKTAQFTEMPHEMRNKYLAEARRALEAAKNLDASYEPTISYLAMVDKSV